MVGVEASDFRNALKALTESNPEHWIQQALERMTPEALKDGMEKNENFVINFFDTKYMNLKGIRNVVATKIDENWGMIEHYLLTPGNMKVKLQENEGNWVLLESDEGIEYLNNVASGAYSWLRDFVYEEEKKLYNILLEKPVLLYRELKDVGDILKIPISRFVEIVDKWEQSGTVEIYITLNEKLRRKNSG